MFNRVEPNFIFINSIFCSTCKLHYIDKGIFMYRLALNFRQAYKLAYSIEGSFAGGDIHWRAPVVERSGELIFTVHRNHGPGGTETRG